jgi:putative transcriptional regulator
MRLLSVLALLLLATMPIRPEARAAPADRATFDGLAGQLLVAEPDLDDPNFDHTVVLMLHHDGEGALGLVINRPYGTAPNDELLRRLGVGAGEPVTGETVLYYGGPVQPDVGMLVHSADYARAGTKRVTGEIAVTSDPTALADLVRGNGPERAIPVLGYAGWAPGQLESELAQGSWFVLPAEPSLVFAADPAKIWATALARRGIDL